MRLISPSFAFTLAAGMAGALSFATPAAAQVAVPAADAPGVVSTTAPPAMAVPASLSFDDQQRAYRRGRGGSDGVGVRLFGALDVEHMAASQSFDAVVGTSTLLGFGAGVDITGIGGDLFVRVALSAMPKSGTRSDGSEFSNGIAVNVKMVPVDLAVGWRFRHLLGDDSLTPFVGGGAFLLHYSEVTPSGDTSDNTSAFFKGYEFFGGVDLRVSRVLTVAPEVDYRGVPNAIGKGGVSADFNETNLGGVAFRITIGARFGGR